MLTGYKQLSKWQANIKHVGNIITSALMIRMKYNLKYRNISVNKLLSDLYGLRPDVLSELFNKYCNAFYGSHAWVLIMFVCMFLFPL